MANKLITTEIYSEDDLKHYGVVGMKWGVRRSNRRVKSLSKKVRKTTKNFDRGRDPVKNVRTKFLKKFEKKNIKSIKESKERNVSWQKMLKLMLSRLLIAITRIRKRRLQ